METKASSRDFNAVKPVVLLTCVALVLRVIALGHKPLWQDEVFSVLFCRMPWARFWSILKSAETNMALYYLLLRPWMRVFTSDAGVRALSLIPSVLTVPVIFAVGRRLYDKRVGLWSAGLFAVNACSIVYAQEARGYSWLVFFVALSYWAFLRVFDAPSLLHCLIYLLASIAAFYCHFYAVFVLLSQLCTLIFVWRSAPWRAFIPNWIVIALAAFPGLRVALLSHGSNLWWLPRPGLVEVYHTITFLAAEDGKAVGTTVAVFMLVPIIYALRSAFRPDRIESLLAPLGLLTPVVVTLMLSAWRPMFFHRFLIICLVPFVLLVAAGLEQMTPRFARPLGAMMVLLSLTATGLSYTKIREDWRDAAAYTARVDGSAPVVFFLKDAGTPFSFYRERTVSPMTEAQMLRLETPPTEVQAKSWAAMYPHIWVVRFPSNAKDPVGPGILKTMQTAYELCGQAQFKAISVSWFSAPPCPAEH